MATDFGTLLRDLREQAGVGLGSLARALDISAPYLSDVERGYRAPFNRDRIMEIAKILEVNPTGLLQAAATSRGFFELPVTASPAAQTVGAALMRGWPSLQDDELEMIQKIVEGAEKKR